MNRDRVLEAYQRVAREEILRSFRKDSCIASTRITIEVLGRYRIPATPLPVRVTIMNRPFMERAKAQGLPKTVDEARRWTEEVGAWSIGLGNFPEVDQVGADFGHVVAVAGQTLIDPSIDQANRPERGIVLPPVLIVPGQATAAFVKGKETMAGEFGDATLIYQARPKETRYRESSNWRNRRIIDPVVTRILEGMRRDLAEEAGVRG